MKNKAHMLVGVFVIGILVGAFEFYDFWTVDFPRMRDEEATEEQTVAQLEAESSKLQSFAQNIQGIKQEFRELNLQLEAALEHMPRTFNLASLLRKLTMLAHNSGIEISVFRPRRELTQAAPVAAAGGAKPEKDRSVFYESVLVEFSVQGPFTQTLVFFDQLARLKRIVNIDSIKMAARRDGEAVRFGLIESTTDVVVRTYRFVE